MLPQHRRVVSLEESLPDFENHKQPVRIRETRKRDGVLYVAGKGPTDSGVMFITPTLEEEEATGFSESVYNINIRESPELLKGGIGGMLKEAAGLAGLDLGQHYTTTLIKYLLPRTQRNKPPKESVAWMVPALHDEIQEVKPKIIVCFGKLAFDQLIDLKVNQSDALGGWFWSERYKCQVFLMDKPILLLTKPEKLETFRILFKEVKSRIDRMQGVEVAENKPVMHFIRNSHDLRVMVTNWMLMGSKLFSVDCEWGGNNHIDGKLRSIQIGWSANEGACITFMNHKKEYVFDISYVEVGALLGKWLNRPEVKYIGHYISVDLPWMATWLNLDWYDKTAFDTAFALQTVDEAAGMGLEVLSLTYTTYGRYDMELMLWRKANRPDPDDGFATIPDEILEPYSILDVLVPFAAMPFLQRRLTMENLDRYYYELFQPFVTNVFTSFALSGLPLDVPQMDDLREMFHFAKDHLQVKFQAAVAHESWQLLATAMNMGGDLRHVGLIAECQALMKAGTPHLMVDAFKAKLGTKWARYEPWLTHCAEAPNFNHQSQPQMLRWLFKCKGLTPVKTTDNKEKGLRSMPWEKVLELPTERQSEFTPAMDKQTLTILSEQSPIVKRLLELKDLGNLCKAFLKEPTIDEKTGELTRENGLHYYVCSDNRAHPNYGTTETGRPRAWKPNTLNWPSYVTERISETIADLFKELFIKGILPAQFHKYVDGPDREAAKVPSIRSCVRAIAGWCIVESDYQTAEIRGLAYISGDLNLMRFMDEVDPSFGFVLVDGKKEAVRMYYEPESISGIVVAEQDPNCLMNLWTKGKWVRKVEQSELVMAKDGTLLHPKYDLHWSLAEMVYEQPREKMIAKLHRGAGKVGNFSSAYGASDATLERKIESDTGKKPEPGTGKKLLEALARRQPVATEFLEMLEQVPAKIGHYVAASGRRRRFYRHPHHVAGISGRTIRGHLSALGREARNFPMQESVAAAAARTGNLLLKFKRDWNLRGYPICILYDSAVTHCPLEEREIWRLAHELFMHLANGWAYDDRILRYPVDHELNMAWSAEPPKATLSIWKDPNFHAPEGNLLEVKKWLESEIQRYQLSPRDSVWNKEDLPVLAA